MKESGGKREDARQQIILARHKQLLHRYKELKVRHLRGGYPGFWKGEKMQRQRIFKLMFEKRKA